jgi:hypothetical protein
VNRVLVCGEMLCRSAVAHCAGLRAVAVSMRREDDLITLLGRCCGTALHARRQRRTCAALRIYASKCLLVSTMFIATVVLKVGVLYGDSSKGSGHPAVTAEVAGFM